jgi:class 3 adenylate cyclase/tetratricopeptide (TPR) repeat protein
VSELRCATCGTDNRAPRRFCGQCGAPLPPPCAQCGFVNDAGTRFCGGCGVALAVAPVATSGAPAPTEAELRPVTVLFADVCGYTRLSQTMLPEDMHALLQGLFDVADEAIVRYGGRVDKHIGDAVMGVFGAPQARGDEPMRAARAARALIEAVRERTAALGRRLDVHVGIAAGEVVASGVGSTEHSAYTVIGPSVNLAARLVDVAGPGEIVVDDAVHAEIAGAATCVALQDLAIKGIERPVMAWRLVTLDAAPARDPPMVGRRHERAQLEGVLRACTSEGAGGVVYLRGDPGIGKSRLTTELMRVARVEGFRCHRALVLDSGTARERDAIRELAGGLLDLAPGAPVESVREALRGAVERGLVTPGDAAWFAALLDLPMSDEARALHEAMDPGTREQETASALARLVRAASRVAPRVIAIEDLHWADAQTLRRIAAIAAAIAEAPVALVLTSRRDGDPLGGPWRTTLRGSLAVIDLGPLSNTDAQRLAGGLRSVSERILQKCVERAAGNPLFLEQLLRAAHEHEDRLPASLQSLVLARVDRLPERDRAALRAASIVGQRFPIALARQLTGLADYRCDTLIEHQLVQSDGDDFLFAHALIRDGIYASITHARRKALHAQAAEWYRARDPALCAEHLERAESPDAAEAYRVAALAERAALRPERALAHAERGLAVARAAADVHALALLRAELFKETGEGPRAVEAGQAALAAAGSPLGRCRALLAVAAGYRLTGEAGRALAALAEAEPLAQEEAATRERVAVHYLRGSVLFARNRVAQSRAEHALAYEGARALADPEFEARALSGLGDADYAEGLIRSAFARFDACLALCEQHGFAHIAIPNRVIRGHCRAYLGEFAAARVDMEHAATAAARVCNRHAEMFALQSLGILLTSWNRLGEAEDSQARALALAREIGARRYLPAILSHHAESLFARGDRERAREELQEGYAILREFGMAFAGGMVLGMLMRLADDPGEHAAHAQEAEAVLAAGSLSHNHVLFRRYGIEDGLARGDLDEVLRHAAALESYTRPEPLPYTDLLIRRARALVALARAPDDASARAAIEAVKEDARRMDWPLAWPS